MKVKLIFLMLFFCFVGRIFSKNHQIKPFLINSNVNKFNSVFVLQINSRPNPILQFFKTKQKKNKKIIATALAFPFPFGIVGLHRIYLGTAPHVPVVYIGTVGGGLGILPFIDFCVLLLDKDFERFNNNNKVFMWVRDEEKKTAK